MKELKFRDLEKTSKNTDGELTKCDNPASQFFEAK